MKISIIIPTLNNLDYLKISLKSIIKNSFYNHEIIVHVNENTDDTIKYLEANNIKYTFSKNNLGLCSSVNLAAEQSTTNLILYAHDDMYFLPKWDKFLIDRVNELSDNKFYLSSIMINGDPKLNGHLNFNAGETADKFDENLLLNNYEKLHHDDFQGSTWAPH